MDDLTNFFMILMLTILEKDRQDKVSEFHKHYKHLKFVKSSIYHARILDKNIWRYVLIFRRVCLHWISIIGPTFFLSCFCHWGHTWGCQLASESIRFCIELFGTVQMSLLLPFHLKNQLFFVKLWKTVVVFMPPFAQLGMDDLTNFRWL